MKYENYLYIGMIKPTEEDYKKGKLMGEVHIKNL